MVSRRGIAGRADRTRRSRRLVPAVQDADDVPPQQCSAGTPFRVAINDQPANPWNSAGDIPAVGMPKYIPSDTPVPGRFLTMLPEDTPEYAVAGLAADLVAGHGTIVDVFPTVAGFSFTGSDAQAQAMSDDGRVESVEQDSYGQETWHRDPLRDRAGAGRRRHGREILTVYGVAGQAGSRRGQHSSQQPQAVEHLVNVRHPGCRERLLHPHYPDRPALAAHP